MKEYYHYTKESLVNSISRNGMFPNHPLYTTTEYYTATQAGQELGVMAHNIDCVLKFSDDGSFKPAHPGVVPATGRFTGGGNQYQHPMRLKPVAKRKIGEKNWTNL